MGMRISYEWDPPEGYPEESRRVGTPHPLHLAVMKGQVEVVRKLFSARRQVIWYKLDEGETIQHSSVKHNRLGVLKLLLEQVGEVEFLNSKHDYDLWQHRFTYRYSLEAV